MSTAPPLRRAVFLDRDGTLLEDTGYPRDPDAVRLLPGAADALRCLSQRGFLLVLVSNQSGIGRGLITPEQAQAVHQRLLHLLAEHGAALHGSYYCPHTPDQRCPCRKPAPGLLLQAARELGIDPRRSFLLGDKRSDIEAGHAAGCRCLLLAPAATAQPGCRSDAVARSWPQALDALLLLAGEAAPHLNPAPEALSPSSPRHP